MQALLDTSSSTTWVFDEDCKDTDPPCKHHNKYKSGSSNTFKEIDKDFKKKYGRVESTGITAEDTIYLADGFPAKKQLFGAVTKHTQVVPFDGIIGERTTRRFNKILNNVKSNHNRGECCFVTECINCNITSKWYLCPVSPGTLDTGSCVCIN